MPNSFAFLRRPAAAVPPDACEPWDSIILETTNFVVVPTVGALIQGWVLIVPRQPFLSMGAIPFELQSELDGLRQTVFEAIIECYGSAAAFEHGPSRTGQKLGCGVDHAHLHVLPARCDLLSGVRDVCSCELNWQGIEGIKDLRRFAENDWPYLYLEQPPDNALVARAEGAPSQLFRRVIANSLGTAEEFDWKANPMVDNVRATFDTLRNWTQSNRFQGMPDLIEIA